MKVRLRKLSMLVRPKTKWTKSNVDQLQWMALINRFKQMILMMTMERNMASGAHLSNIRIKWSLALMKELAFSVWHLLKCTPCNNVSHLCRPEWWERRQWHGRVWVLGVVTASSTADHLSLLSRTRTWRIHKNQAMMLIKMHSLKLKGSCLACSAVCGLLLPRSLDGAETETMMKSLISNEQALTPYRDSEMTSRKTLESCQMELRHQ